MTLSVPPSVTASVAPTDHTLVDNGDRTHSRSRFSDSTILESNSDVIDRSTVVQMDGLWTHANFLAALLFGTSTQ